MNKNINRDFITMDVLLSKDQEYKKYIDTIDNDRKEFKEFIEQYRKEMINVMTSHITSMYIDESIMSRTYKNSFHYPVERIMNAQHETTRIFINDIKNRTDCKSSINIHPDRPIMIYHMTMVKNIIENHGSNIKIIKYKNNQSLYVADKDKKIFREYVDSKSFGIIYNNICVPSIKSTDVEWEITLEEKTKEKNIIFLENLVYLDNQDITIDSISIEGIELTKDQKKYLKEKVSELFYSRDYKDYLKAQIYQEFIEFVMDKSTINHLENVLDILRRR